MESGIKLPPPPPKRAMPIPPPPKNSANNSTKTTSSIRARRTSRAVSVTPSEVPNTPEVKSEIKPEVKPEANPEVKPEVKSTRKAAAKPGVKIPTKPAIPAPISRPNQSEVVEATESKPKAPAKKTAVPTKKVQEETGISILEASRSYWGGTPSQIQTLSHLSYPNGDRIIDPNRRDILLEIIGMLIGNDFATILEFLRAAPAPDFILWEQPSMEEGHNALARELELQQTEEKGIKGIGKCRFCPSTELIVKQVQMRSGDEGMTVFTRCVMCQKQWRT